jgi:hypothetical protein
MIAVALLLLFWMPCSHGHTFEYDGKWEARRILDARPGADPEIVLQASRVILTIKPNGTFDLTDAGFSHSGTYSVEGDHAILTITTVLGQPMSRQAPDVQARNKPIRIMPLHDGTLRFYDPGGFDQTGLIMKRDTADKPK